MVSVASETKFLRLSQVEQLVGRTSSTIYRMMDLKIFPRPFNLGPKSVAWREDEIKAWMDSRPRSTTGRREVQEAVGS